MKKLIIIALGIFTFTSGCKKEEEVTEGYWRMTFTADVNVYYDGSISGGACTHSGYIGAALYFPFDGGDVVHQESFVTINTVSHPDCMVEMRSQTANIPITLNAVLDVTSVRFGDAQGNVEAVFDDFRIWMETPVIFPIDIYFDCGGLPSVETDYGNAVSQITSPFLTHVWSFSPQYDKIHNATYTGYAFPPTFLSDIEFSMYEDYVLDY
jgi:hypothetical protein